MKLTLRRMNICFTIVWFLATFSLSTFRLECSAQTREPLHQELYDGLKEYKRLAGQEMSKFPRLANKTINQGSQESNSLVRVAQRSFSLGNLEEAEEKLAQALILSENQETRQFYAFVLIEEKKYLEALPSCLEISLENHENFSRLTIPTIVECDSLSNLMLAYVLAQIGETRASAFAYNWARKRVEMQLKNEISRIPIERREKVIASFPHWRYPLPPFSIDPDTADRKTLLEANRILFLFASKSSSNFGLKRLANRLIDEAYEDNPGSAQITFYKAVKTLTSHDDGLKQRLAAEQACQPYYQKAADLAGAKSTLGKLALECLKHAKESEIDTQKTIDEIDKMRPTPN